MNLYGPLLWLFAETCIKSFSFSLYVFMLYTDTRSDLRVRYLLLCDRAPRILLLRFHAHKPVPHKDAMIHLETHLGALYKHPLRPEYALFSSVEHIKTFAPSANTHKTVPHKDALIHLKAKLLRHNAPQS
jgi:hypothetical protein